MNHKRMLLALAFALLLGCTAAATSRAGQASVVQTATFTASQDNTLYEDAAGATSNGAGSHLFAGTTSSGAVRRAVLAFDLAASVPATATIVSVELTLFMSKSTAGPEPVALHRLTAAWGEGASDANSQEGGGAAAQPGDATWLHTFCCDQRWVQAGGDFAAAASATTMVAGVGSYSWTSPALVQDVQGWVANSGSNSGWLVLGSESASRTAKRFASRENSSAEVRPQLSVTYFLPTDRLFLPRVGRNIAPR